MNYLHRNVSNVFTHMGLILAGYSIYYIGVIQGYTEPKLIGIGAMILFSISLILEAWPIIKYLLLSESQKYAYDLGMPIPKRR